MKILPLRKQTGMLALAFVIALSARSAYMTNLRAQATRSMIELQFGRILQVYPSKSITIPGTKEITLPYEVTNNSAKNAKIKITAIVPSGSTLSSRNPKDNGCVASYGGTQIICTKEVGPGKTSIRAVVAVTATSVCPYRLAPKLESEHGTITAKDVPYIEIESKCPQSGSAAAGESRAGGSAVPAQRPAGGMIPQGGNIAPTAPRPAETAATNQRAAAPASAQRPAGVTVPQPAAPSAPSAGTQRPAAQNPPPSVYDYLPFLRKPETISPSGANRTAPGQPLTSVSLPPAPRNSSEALPGMTGPAVTPVQPTAPAPVPCP